MAFDLSPSLGDILTLKSSRTLVVALIPILLTLNRVWRKKPRRYIKVPKTQERVLVIGASSGIGRSIARQYAARGARVCIVGRRESMLQEVEAECRAARSAMGFPASDLPASDIFSVTADFASPNDIVRVRKAVEDAWGGLDTHVIAAGVSALQPLMAVAGVELERGVSLKDASPEGIQHTTDVALAAIRGNYHRRQTTGRLFLKALNSCCLC